MQLVVPCDGWQYCRAPAREEWRCSHEQGAQQIQKPRLLIADREDEREGNKSTDEVACDHDAPAVEPVEQNPGERPNQHSRNSACEHHASDNRAIVSCSDSQTEHSHIIEVIAHLANDLADPCVPIVPVPLQEPSEILHQLTCRRPSIICLF